MKLSRSEKQRYARQLVMPEIGEQGQLILKRAHVVIIGAGGLGVPALMHLAGAGVGALSIVDSDVIERSNLHRQTIYTDADIGEPKALVAQRWVQRFNPDILVESYVCRFSEKNAAELLSGASLIIDATDSLETRRLINRTSLALSLPWIMGAVSGWSGYLALFNPREKNAPCFSCFCPDDVPDDALPLCSQTGILGAASHIIGSWQALQAIRFLLHLSPSFSSRLLRFNGQTGDVTMARLQRDLECGACAVLSS